MDTNPTYAAYWRSLSPEYQEVMRRMDEHENLGHAESAQITDEMLRLLVKLWAHINELADTLADDEQERVRHVETLTLILSFSPNSGSTWFLKELIREQPAMYDEIYRRALTQTPLQMHGKLLRERLLFHITREQVLTRVFSPEVRLAVITALEGMTRES